MKADEIKALFLQFQQASQSLEPIVREAIASKNQEENELGRLADSLSEIALLSEAGNMAEAFHQGQKLEKSEFPIFLPNPPILTI